MTYTTLIAPAELAPNVDNPDWAVIDCRFSLDDPGYGLRAYREAHIPNALYAHLDEQLSGKVVAGVTGRHPLPTVEEFTRTLSRWGIEAHVQVVVYDDWYGGYAARLWWMLRWMGHNAVALLDGGFPRWQRECYTVRGGGESRDWRPFKPNVRNDLLVTTAEMQQIIQNPDYRIIDARSADRYRGENETRDPLAGHIPGALNAPFTENVDGNGLFLPAEALRERYHDLLGDATADHTIFYCGSGVTAAHDALALTHAGLGDGRVYVGSWSEWSANPERPIETGSSKEGESTPRP
ncbi:MAG: sulfurtransferase [Chloroflexaceae bacterium]|nr:sulfurtransferase [Chloroflexaceae bacterium]NJO06063.1 sulfurtransferase [Chloroflexaceae bacterium]